MVLVNRLKHKSQAIQLQNAQFRLIVARMQSDSLKAAFRKPFFSLRDKLASKNKYLRLPIASGSSLGAGKIMQCKITLSVRRDIKLSHGRRSIPSRGNNIP